MRLALALLAAVLLAPPVLAQAGPPAATLSVTPPTDVVRPLQGSVGFPFQLVVHCPPSGMLPPGPRVHYSVTRMPAWASVAVSPETDAIDPFSCQPSQTGGPIVRHGFVTVSASDAAPAFTPDVVELEAVVTMPMGEQGHARASVPIVAGFFSILDATPVEPMKRAAPGQAVAFPVRVTNFGNANTRVSFELESPSEGARVVLPKDLMLQSRQAGGSQVSSEAIVAATRLPGAIGDIPIVVRYTSHYALDPKLQGDSGTFALLLRGGGAEPDALEAAATDPPAALRELPLSPLAAIAAGVGAALLRRR